MTPFKLLIVDDQKLFSTSLAGILKTLGSGIVGEVELAFDAPGALHLMDRFKPDIVLLDIFMPGTNGLDLIEQFKQRRQGARIVMLTTFGYENYIRDALSKGAVGYLLKDSTPEEVLTSLSAVINGSTVFSPEAIDTLSGKNKAFNPAKSVVPSWFSTLNEKEKKLLLLLSRGMSNEEIAEKLFLGQNTIRNYVSTVYSKIGAKDRFEAMHMAIDCQIHLWVLE